MQLTFLTSLLLVLPFYYAEHPLAMTLVIVLQTFLIALTTSSMNCTMWYGYILFLVFLGGMLVLFIYITSLAANEIFKPLVKYTLMLTGFVFIIMIITNTVLDNYLLHFMHFTREMMETSNMYITYQTECYIINKLYDNPTNLLTLMLVSYLFLTLIAVVKITNIFLGPLRQQY